jgi:hypothetical protein
MFEIKELSIRRFEALAGYIRRPEIVLCIEEIEWFATLDERLVGMLARDRIDSDFSWVILGRDERLRFRAIDLNSSLSSPDAARQQLFERMKEQYDNPTRPIIKAMLPARRQIFSRILWLRNG